MAGYISGLLWCSFFWGNPDIHDKIMDWIDRQDVICPEIGSGVESENPTDLIIEQPKYTQGSVIKPPTKIPWDE